VFIDNHLGGFTMPPSSTTTALLTVRAALILLLALVVGISAGILSYLTDRSVAGAVLLGGGATGGALLLFHTLIGRT
jgi:hypothetical protein